jgi:hypothetical protein
MLRGKWIQNKQTIAETFNNYFLSVTKNRKGTCKQSNTNIKNPLKITWSMNQLISWNGNWQTMPLKIVLHYLEFFEFTYDSCFYLL